MIILSVSVLLSCDDDDDPPLWQAEIELLKAAITPYDHIEHAFHDGYDAEVTGYRKHMGYHYLNAGLLDDKFEVEKPELLLYAPDENNN